jgi:hypothetical protein
MQLAIETEPPAPPDGTFMLLHRLQQTARV